MECPRCGYLLLPGESECPRCKGSGSRSRGRRRVGGAWMAVVMAGVIVAAGAGWYMLAHRGPGGSPEPSPPAEAPTAPPAPRTAAPAAKPGVKAPVSGPVAKPAPPAAVIGDPKAAAEQYLGHLRNREIDQAAALCWFENAAASREWRRQAQQYLAGQRAWWGECLNVDMTAAPAGGSGRWAQAEVAWRYRAGSGWMMGSHRTYFVRDAGDGWKIAVEAARAQQGYPFFP